jgi:hypothetical protein
MLDKDTTTPMEYVSVYETTIAKVEDEGLRITEQRQGALVTEIYTPGNF